MQLQNPGASHPGFCLRILEVAAGRHNSSQKTTPPRPFLENQSAVALRTVQ